MGWIMPSVLIDSANSKTDSSLKFVLGWKGLISICFKSKSIIFPVTLSALISFIELISF